MKILYFHGFGSSLNGKKASFLRAHFGQSAVIEPPDPGFPYCKAITRPLWDRLSTKFRNEPQSLLGLLRPNHFLELNGLCPEIENFFPRSVAMAQEVYDRVRPDVIVGTSLGGSVAMAMNSRNTPLVLIDPVWNRNVKPGIRSDKLPIAGPMGKVLLSAAVAALRNPIAQLAAFDVPPTIKPETIILHSAHDHVFEATHSRALIRNNPIAANYPRRAEMHRVVENLTALGYANTKSNIDPHFNDGRLIIIGKDHHNNDIDPNDRENKDPHPHNAMVAAVRVLLDQFSSH